VAAVADAGALLERKTKIAPKQKEAWVIPLMRAQDEEDQENRQHQGEEEALPMVKVEGEEEIALIENVIEEEENPFTVAFRKEKELDQKIETALNVVKNLELQKSRAERRVQAHIEERDALKRKMAEMMEAKLKDIRRSL